MRTSLDNQTIKQQARICLTLTATLAFSVAADRISAVSAQLFPPAYELRDMVESNGADGLVIDPQSLILRGLAGNVDLNNDGIQDLVTKEINFSPSEGRVNVILGDPVQPAEVLTGVSPGPGVLSIVGQTDAELRDALVSAGGDWNCDGIDDLVITASTVYVVFGGPVFSAGAFTLSSLLPANGGDGSHGVVITLDVGEEANSAAVVGDVNSDGCDDLAIGTASSSGRTYVLYGESGEQPATVQITDFENSLAPAGFVTTDSGARVDALAGLDINADGTDDLVLGMPTFDNLSGHVIVMYGDASGFNRTVSLLSLFPDNGGDGSTGFIVRGATSQRLGRALNADGDINNDGMRDLIIANQRLGDGPPPSVPVIYARSVPFPADFLGNSPGVAGGSAIRGGLSDRIGFDVSSGGDVNADGIDDVLITDPTSEAGDGYAYVVYGQAGGLPLLTNATTLGSGDGSTGFQVTYIPSIITPAADNLLYAAMTDLNGDGVADFVFDELLTYGRTDTDNDGVADHQDNCSLVANADQTDADDDGFGNACDGDFNNDCWVNFLDLTAFSDAFLTADPEKDLDGDGAVNFIDLSLLQALFFAAPGPSGQANVCEL